MFIKSEITFKYVLENYKYMSMYIKYVKRRIIFEGP